MAVAERFVIKPGDKVLIIGCKESDFESWLNKRPDIKDRVDFMTEDDLERKGSISSIYNGILSCRHINHSNTVTGKVDKAKKNGVYFRLFPRSLDLKTFLELSVINVPPSAQKGVWVDDVVRTQTIGDVVDAINGNEVENENENKKDIELRKPKRGEIQNFVLDNANLSSEKTKLQVNELLRLITASGIKTTRGSVETVFYKVRKINKVTDPSTSSGINPELPKKALLKKLKLKEENVLLKYLDSLTEFSNNSLIAGVAIKELMEKNKSLEEQISILTNQKSSEKEELQKKIQELEKENKELKKKFKKGLANFLKDL